MTGEKTRRHWLDGFRTAGRLDTKAVILLGLIALSAALGTVANVSFPVLSRDHPLVLAVLDARPRQLAIVSHKIPWLLLFCVAVARRMSTHIIYYLLGRWYGEIAITFLVERSVRSGRAVRAVQRVFSKVARGAVLLTSGNIVCALAGAQAMTPVTFVTLKFIGNCLQVGLLLALAHQARPVLEPLVDRLDGNASWLTRLLIAGLVLWVAGSALRRRLSARRRKTFDDSP